MPLPRQKKPATLQKEVDAFNSKFEVGETVNVKNDFGVIEKDVIRHKATIMCGSSVAWLETKGSYLLERVSKC